MIAQPEQAPVSTGICEIWESAPIEFEYDNDCAVCYMLEGRVTLTEGRRGSTSSPATLSSYRSARA